MDEGDVEDPSDDQALERGLQSDGDLVLHQGGSNKARSRQRP